MDWAREQAQRINEAGAIQREQRQWQVHTHAVIASHRPGMMRRLFEQIEEYVSAFNSALPVGSEALHVERDSQPSRQSIRVKKESFPRRDIEIVDEKWFSTTLSNNLSEPERSNG